MEPNEALALMRMFWILVGFPVLIVSNVALSVIAWDVLREGDDGTS